MYTDTMISKFADAILKCDNIKKALNELRIDDDSEGPVQHENSLSSMLSEALSLCGNYESSIQSLSVLYSDFINNMISIMDEAIKDYHEYDTLDVDSQMIIEMGKCENENYRLYDLNKIYEFLNSSIDDFINLKGSRGEFHFDSDEFRINDMKEFTVTSIVNNHCIGFVDVMRRIASLQLFDFMQEVIENGLVRNIRILYDIYRENEYDVANIGKDDDPHSKLYNTILNTIEFIRFLCKTIYTLSNAFEMHFNLCLFACREHAKARYK